LLSQLLPSSPRRDFKRYDVMGAIVVRLSR
jgi:hypothetical protein